ncbi:hypothetical protein [Fischerella thermalis]|uniref:hypothetical protein n=1 Tax=Fischerella thermalis TaxID=372787 RepID=UPI00307E27F4
MLTILCFVVRHWAILDFGFYPLPITHYPLPITHYRISPEARISHYIALAISGESVNLTHTTTQPF